MDSLTDTALRPPAHIGTVVRTLEARVRRPTERLSADEVAKLKALLNPVQCQVCGDARFIQGNFPLGHELFGKVFPCPSCNRQKARVGPTDMNGLYASDYYLSWKDVLELGENGERVREVKTYVQKCLFRNWGFLYLWGTWGTGKSEIGRVAVAESLRNDKRAVYLSMFDLLDYLYSGEEGKRDYQLNQRINEIASAHLLVIDEVEKFYQDKGGMNWLTVFHMLDKRYDYAMRSKTGVTLLISNEPPEKLAATGAEGRAIYDRLTDDRGKIMHLTGDSLRPIASKLEALK